MSVDPEIILEYLKSCVQTNSREMKSYVDTKTGALMFLSSLFKITLSGKISSNEWMVKHTMVHLSHGMLLRNKKE